MPGHSGAAPLLWLVGTHGGAGVTSLAMSISFAGDAGRRWPGLIGSAGEVDSPFVVLVARTHMSGLAAVHHALLAHMHSATPAGTHLLGVVTVADSDRPLSKPVGTRRSTVESLTRDVGGEAWRLGWLEPWRSLEPHELPSWSPANSAVRLGDRDPTRTPPAPVAALAEQIFATARTAIGRYRNQHSIPAAKDAAAAG
ncbi:hypothetical protein [Nocardia amamiensis]|uniref:hypothetical protein n=1 Tax=Nocardia amamiensis TaxID=404578 RepID=UPI0012F5066B|nr:hypothetical protein [Nocardia amamiensis]